MSSKTTAKNKKAKKKSTPTTVTPHTETTSLDIEKLVDKGKESLANKRNERKAQRKEARVARKEASGTGDGSIKHHKDGSSTTYDKRGQAVAKTFAQNGKSFTLKEAKLHAKDESKQHRKPLYVNVTEKGDFDFGLGYDPKSSLHCYRNGSEVAMEVPKKGPSSIKQTPEGENSTTMAKAKKNDRPAKKSVGKIQKLSIKAIVALLKKGKVVRHERGFLPKLKNLTKKNQDLVWPVSVEA